MAEGDGLLNRCTALKPYRGFESLRLRVSGICREATKAFPDSNQGSVASRQRPSLNCEAWIPTAPQRRSNPSGSAPLKSKPSALNAASRPFFAPYLVRELCLEAKFDSIRQFSLKNRKMWTVPALARYPVQGRTTRRIIRAPVYPTMPVLRSVLEQVPAKGG